MKREAMHPGQRSALDLTVARFIGQEPYTAIVLPTRYGKSDTMRLIALDLWLDGHMKYALALSPNIVLRDQLANANKWKIALERYEVRCPQVPLLKLQEIAWLYEGTRDAEAPMFISSTMQFVHRNIDTFRQWVNSVCQRTGRAPLLFVDECHTGSESNEWGHDIEVLVRAGARAALFTATAIRSDGKRIPGFEFDVLEETSAKVTMVNSGSQPELIRVEIYEGVKRLLKLRAHHTTTFADAWAERPSPLCKVGRVPFDVDMSRVELGEKFSGEWLSEQRGQDVRRALSRSVRTAVVIREGCERLVRTLASFQASGVSDAAAIVFCGNDSEKDDPGVNRHAEQIKREIQRRSPDLKVVIATAVNAEQENDSGKDKIEAFGNGVGDVLIVKQMASLGLDIPRLKVGLDLSPVRTPAAYVQRMMRIATPYGHVRHCVWIGPDDILSRALFEELVGESGGAATVMDLELVSSYEKEREDSDPLPDFQIDGTGLSDFEDTDRNYAQKGGIAVAEALLQAFPSLIQQQSHAEIVARASQFSISPVAPVSPERTFSVCDVGDEVGLIRADINTTAAEIVGMRMSHGGYDRSTYGELSSATYRDAYRAAGVSMGTHLSGITSTRVLQAVHAALRKMHDEYRMSATR